VEFISSIKADFYFDRIAEINGEINLTPKERIPKFRSVMELLFKELTSDEKIIFTTLHSRQAFYFNTYTNAPKELFEELRQFRQFANQVVHNPDLKPSLEEELQCLKILCKAISYFCQKEIPSTLQNLFSNKELSFRKVEFKQTENLYLIFHRILNYYENKNYKKLSLQCEHTDLGLITLYIWYDKRNIQKLNNISSIDWTKIQHSLEPFTNLYVTAVRPDASQSIQYHTTNKTIIVLEPDFLIDVTEIAECFQNNGAYQFMPLFKKFLKSEPSFELLKGTIINYIFDELLTNPHFNFDGVFSQALKTRLIDLLSITKITSVNSNLPDLNKRLEAQVESHYKRLEAQKGFFLKKKKLIEPAFISTKYGIQGRLDLLLISQDDVNHIEIVELKSGKAPSNAMWQNNLIQTILYDLLIQSVFPNRKGESYICYSSDDKPLRAYPGTEWIYQQQQAMDVRNIIVTHLFRIANGDLHEIINESKNIEECNIPKYLIEKVKNFYKTIESLDKIEKSYFFGFCKFLARELIELKIGNSSSEYSSDGYSSLWKKTITEKKDTFSILDNLVITSIDDSLFLTLHSKDGTAFPVSDFREGDLTLLYPYDGDNTDPTKFLLLKCFIVEFSEKHIKLQLLNRLTDSEYLSNYNHWVLEHEFRESSFTTLFQFLYTFVSSDKSKRDIILGRKKPQFETVQVQFKTQLSTHQKEVIRLALSSKDYFLIQGPPGTGKTSVIMKELVSQLYERKENILLIAYTNRAVDEICSRLLEIDNLNYIRIGKGQDSTVLFSELAKKLTLDELSKKIEDTQVFVSTQASLSTNFELLNLKSFDTLIVDEASQLLEPHLLGILPKVKRFILIGDEKQLPPVVVQSKEQTLNNDPLLKEIVLESYNESIFSRLLKNAKHHKWTKCYTSLIEHYRMHRDIARFINEQYYGSILKEALDFQNEDLNFIYALDELDEILFTNRLVFISVPSEPFQQKVNKKEAQLVSVLAKKFYHLYQQKKLNLKYKQFIGIITPFRAQITAIKNYLENETQDITVDTVERFQGSERNVIIISFAFKNISQAKMIQSIYNDTQNVERKLNVAVSRAKEHLIVVGDKKILEQDIHYSKLLDYIDKYGKTLKFEEISSYLTN